MQHATTVEPQALQEPKREGTRVVETWVVEQKRTHERSRISPAALKSDVRFHASDHENRLPRGDARTRVTFPRAGDFS